MKTHWFLEIILEKISFTLGSSLNYLELIKYSLFVAFNLYNFGSLVHVIIGLGSFQLDFSFIGLCW
jgi:hypothetical protein